jgi:hypothetical protein
MGKGKKKNDAQELPFVDGTHPVYRAAKNGDPNAVKRRAELHTARHCVVTAVNT